MSSIEIWLPGAMQSTEAELGKSSNTAKTKAAALPLKTNNSPKLRFMSFASVTHDK
jgi:hypothetical protein